MDFLGLSLDFPWIPEKNRAGGREIERAGGREFEWASWKIRISWIFWKSWKIQDFFGGRRAERQKNDRSVENVTGNHFFAKKIGWEWNHHLFGGSGREVPWTREAGFPGQEVHATKALSDHYLGGLKD